MLFRLAKNNRAASYAMLLLLATGAWSYGYFVPPGFSFYEGETHMLLFLPLYRFASVSPAASGITGLILIMLSAVLIQRISSEHGIFRIRGMLPGILFILITAGFKESQILHPVQPAAVLLLLAIHRIFRAFDQRKPYSQVFDAGLLLASASLFYLNMIFLLPLFVIGGNMLGRETHWREMVLTVAGFLLPWIFVLSGYFLFDDISRLTETVRLNLLTASDRVSGHQATVIYLAFLMLLTLAGSFYILRQYDEKKVSLRQFYLIFFMIFLTTLLVYFIVPAASSEILFLSAIPVTFLLANLMLSVRSRIPGEIIFYLLAVLVILVRLT